MPFLALVAALASPQSLSESSLQQLAPLHVAAPIALLDVGPMTTKLPPTDWATLLWTRNRTLTRSLTRSRPTSLRHRSYRWAQTRLVHWWMPTVLATRR